MPATFRAFVVNKTGDRFTAQVQELTPTDLPPGEVLIRVAYSGVNYKDALACIPDGKIVRSYPFVPVWTCQELSSKRAILAFTRATR